MWAFEVLALSSGGSFELSANAVLLSRRAAEASPTLSSIAKVHRRSTAVFQREGRTVVICRGRRVLALQHLHEPLDVLGAVFSQVQHADGLYRGDVRHDLRATELLSRRAGAVTVEQEKKQ